MLRFPERFITTIFRPFKKGREGERRRESRRGRAGGGESKSESSAPDSITNVHKDKSETHMKRYPRFSAIRRQGRVMSCEEHFEKTCRVSGLARRAWIEEEYSGLYSTRRRQESTDTGSSSS
jgi:hypothetical protein